MRRPLVLGLWAALLCACAESRSERPPDLLFILCDTLRADAVHGSGRPNATPALDRLARESVAFPLAFAHAPMTLPAHTALFSARPPSATGVWVNGEQVPGDLPLLAEHLRAHGYQTRAVVSIGTLKAGRQAGLARGFESYDEDFRYIDSAAGVEQRLARSLAARDPERPLFLFAHFSDPHEPYDAHGLVERSAVLTLGDRELERFSTSDSSVRVQRLELAAGTHEFRLVAEDPFRVRDFTAEVEGRPLAVEWRGARRMEATRDVAFVVESPGDAVREVTVHYWVNDVAYGRTRDRRYAKEVEHVDAAIGRLLDDLRARGWLERAIVVFTSDHGESLGERDFYGHATDVDDVQLRVPLLLRLAPGDARAARLAERAHQPVGHMDLVPTLLELCGLPPLPGARGVSLLAGASTPIPAETHRPEAPADRLALRDELYKMVYLPGEERFLLFDLRADPREERDLFAERPDARPDWPERLRAQEREGRARRAGTSEQAPEDAAALEALGYGGEK